MNLEITMAVWRVGGTCAPLCRPPYASERIPDMSVNHFWVLSPRFVSVFSYAKCGLSAATQLCQDHMEWFNIEDATTLFQQ